MEKGEEEMVKKKIICPKCGQENDALSLECSRCGIVFLKYYDIQAREETDEEKKAELIAKKEKEEEKTESLAKKKEEEERAEALRRQKEEEEQAEALRRQKEEEEKKALQKKIEDITNVLKPKAKIKDLLKKYEGQTVGINHDNPTEIKGADLIKVGDDLFSILLADEKLIKSYPLRTIISIIEGVNGVSNANMEENSKFSIVILVHYPVL